MGYRDAQVQHLPRKHSDHCPLLLSMFKNERYKGNKTFRLETMWTSHPDFSKIVIKAWKNKENLLEALKTLETDVSSWKNTTFGDIFYKKRRLLK